MSSAMAIITLLPNDWEACMRVGVTTMGAWGLLGLLLTGF